MPSRYLTYYQPTDERPLACAGVGDLGPCPDGCGFDIAINDAIAQDPESGEWVLAGHGEDDPMPNDDVVDGEAVCLCGEQGCACAVVV